LEQLWPHLRRLLKQFFCYVIPGQEPAAEAGFNGNSLLEVISEIAYLVGELTDMDATTEWHVAVVENLKSLPSLGQYAHVAPANVSHGFEDHDKVVMIPVPVLSLLQLARDFFLGARRGGGRRRHRDDNLGQHSRLRAGGRRRHMGGDPGRHRLRAGGGRRHMGDDLGRHRLHAGGGRRHMGDDLGRRRLHRGDDLEGHWWRTTEGMRRLSSPGWLIYSRGRPVSPANQGKQNCAFPPGVMHGWR
jgi:hypothetical protein